MTDDIVLEDPPKRRKRSPWTDFLLALKEHPDKWARAELCADMKAANQLAGRIRNAVDALGGGWDVVARSLPEGGAGVWVKYWVGTDQLASITVEVIAPDGTRSGPIPGTVEVLDQRAHPLSTEQWEALAQGERSTLGAH